jgi:hypothetical protein
LSSNIKIHEKRVGERLVTIVREEGIKKTQSIHTGISFEVNGGVKSIMERAQGENT